MPDLDVLVADDHPTFREGVRALLASVPGCTVVAEAATGREAVDLAVDLLPDVVLMDLHMPVLNGVDATRELTQKAPGIAVLVLTMLDNDDSIFAAMRAGARGYILKEAAAPDIVRAVEAVARGEAIFAPTIADRILRYFAQTSRTPDISAFPQLTEREQEILGHIAAGQNNAAIARTLGLQPKTVRNNVSNIFAKLHVADRAQAIVRARQAGLGMP
jgi:DNA-binding NarL/FixJ family response regulator